MGLEAGAESVARLGGAALQVFFKIAPTSIQSTPPVHSASFINAHCARGPGRQEVGDDVPICSRAHSAEHTIGPPAANTLSSECGTCYYGGTSGVVWGAGEWAAVLPEPESLASTLENLGQLPMALKLTFLICKMGILTSHCRFFRV